MINFQFPMIQLLLSGFNLYIQSVSMEILYYSFLLPSHCIVPLKDLCLGSYEQNSAMVNTILIRGDVKIPTYKPHTNHKRSSVRSHTLAPTTICGLSHSLYWSLLTDLGHISSVTYVCHPLWFVCGHRKRILTSPLSPAPWWQYHTPTSWSNRSLLSKLFGPATSPPYST